MGTSLNGLTPAGTYPGLIKTGDNAPIDGTLKTLSDGNGNNLPMSVSTTTINLTGTAQVGGVAIANTTQVAAKQDTLVSGTNIKTINGTSLLGSGNIPVVTSPSGVAGAIQFSNGSAFASDAANLFWDDTNNRLGVGTNAPTGKLQVTESFTTTGNNYSAITFDGTLTSRATASDTIFGFRNTQSIVATATGQTIIANDLTPNYTFFDANTNYVGLKVGGSANTQNLGTAIWCVQKTTAGNNGLAISPYNSRWAIGMTSATTNNINGCDLIIGQDGIGVGISGSNPNARLDIKGSGSTSATTSLLVQNSVGSEAFRIKDDLTSSFAKTIEVTPSTNYGLNAGYLTQTANSFLVMREGISTGYKIAIGTDGTGSTIFYNNQTNASFVSGDISLTIAGATKNVLIGTTTDIASSLMTLASTTKGFLPPRMTTTEKNAIATPAAGLVVYDSTTNKLCCYNGSTWNDLF